MIGKLTVVLCLAGCGAAGAGPTDLAVVDADPPDAVVVPDLASTFGQVCDPNADGCSADTFCLWAPTDRYFCSQACATQGARCPGGPDGSAAFCIVTNATPDGKGGCGFVCAAHGASFACPTGLTCQTSEDPPGSGQRLCLP